MESSPFDTTLKFHHQDDGSFKVENFEDNFPLCNPFSF